MLFVAAALSALSALAPRSLTAQTTQPAASPATATIAPTITPARVSSVVYPTSDVSDRIRLAQLAGDTAYLDSYLLRSPSIMARRARKGGAARPTLSLLAPTEEIIVNSALPFSLNDGALWAGRGLNVRATAGLQGWHGRLHWVLAPELDFSPNAKFAPNPHPDIFFTPQVPPDRYEDGFADPWYAVPYSADVPWRFGKDPLLHIAGGQTGAWYDTGPVEVGVTSENMWWGPGIRNAIVMSDNASGVPRIELRTPRPWRTRIGAFNARWFVGALTESQYFDSTQANDVRSLAAAAVTWQPSFQPSLTLGVTRAVFATASGYGDVPLRWLDVFANTGHPADRALSDSSLYPGGKDQLISLFGRWIFPADGFEVYTEWARQELPKSLHDFILSPSQSHGYTLGLQYRKPAPLTSSTIRVQAEATTLEQSPTFANRPVGSFYTSRRVIQGYTEKGQPIGAAIGPGSSSEWIAVDRVSPGGSLGVTFTRIRWNEDVRSTYNFPAYVGYCNHDVSILPGVRGGKTVPGGYLSGNLIVGTRFNAFFHNQSGCPHGGAFNVDVHTTTVSLSFTPFAQ
ncbi:MAG: capsule assembly Wzi family protein [Gemmatimonadaceae bacterium]